VRGEIEETGQMRKEITVENILQQTRMDEANAAYMRSNASNALLSGNIAMLGEFFTAGSSAFKGGLGGGPSGPITTTGADFGVVGPYAKYPEV